MQQGKRQDVAIVAAGLITSLDDGARDTWEAMRAGAAVVDRGVVADALLPDVACDRATRIALAAIGPLRHLLTPETPLFVGTSKGPILSWLAALEAVRGGRAMDPRLARQVTLGPAAIGADIAAALGLRGPVHTSVAACSSGLHALHRAVRAIECGEVERALVVAADASHHPLFEGSFARLGVIPPTDADGHRRCRPFDPAGNGFVVSEAAAAVLIERGRGEVIIDHSWIGADSTGMIAIDPRATSLRYGLAHAAVAGAPPAFVHAHATGTAHDSHELAAIRQVVGGDVPMVSSKGALGHSLGAAGLVSVVLSARAHRERALWTGQAIARAATSLTISQGFGGHIAVVRLRGE